jgi:sortase (surface protein transpeptidase)
VKHKESADIGTMVKDIQRIETSRFDDKPMQKLRFYRRVSETVNNMFVSRKSIAMSAMSLLLLAGGVVALISAFTTNHVVGSQVKALSEKASSVDESLGASDSDTGVPSEEKVPEAVVNSYTTPADEPRYIYIPKIKNAKTRVLKMGVGKDNAIQTPRTTWDTGWYEGSSKPGDKVGASLIVGHVSGLTGGGVFYNLYRLVDGDEIIVEMGDGTKYTYKVVSKEEVPLDGINMNNYLRFKKYRQARTHNHDMCR